MSIFSEVREFIIPNEICDRSDQILREAGLKSNEHFVLLSGKVHEDRFSVNTLHNPCQTSSNQQGGLLVEVDGYELFKLNKWLHENEEQLAIQIHTHPSVAFHSDIDDRFPMVTTVGGLSLVVPDFCKWGIRGPHTALYRLSDEGWIRLSAAEAELTVRIDT